VCEYSDYEIVLFKRCVFDYFSGLIDDKPLRFRGEVYHGYHFNCTACGVELNSEAREVRSRPGFAANEMVCKGKGHPLMCHEALREGRGIALLFL
jgi:hypothetical protein